jgi:hypothetical protein
VIFTGLGRTAGTVIFYQLFHNRIKPPPGRDVQHEHLPLIRSLCQWKRFGSGFLVKLVVFVTRLATACGTTGFKGFTA